MDFDLATWGQVRPLAIQARVSPRIFQQNPEISRTQRSAHCGFTEKSRFGSYVITFVASARSIRFTRRKAGSCDSNAVPKMSRITIP